MERDTTNIAISLDAVGKTFSVRDKSTNTIRDSLLGLLQRSKKRKIQALEPISFDVKKGETFGIIGRNGSGKSTLLNLILGLYPHNQGGSIVVNGKMIKLALGMGFDKQLSGKENIYINGSILGLTFKKIDALFPEIVKFSGLENFMDTKVKFYSKGMKSRLMFAMAVHAESDIFLFDEFFGGVGDELFKQKSEEMFQNAFKSKTIILVSHNLATIRDYCDRVLLLDKGKCIAMGSTEEILNEYHNLIKNIKMKNN